MARRTAELRSTARTSSARSAPDGSATAGSRSSSSAQRCLGPICSWTARRSVRSLCAATMSAAASLPRRLEVDALELGRLAAVWVDPAQDLKVGRDRAADRAARRSASSGSRRARRAWPACEWRRTRPALPVSVRPVSGESTPRSPTAGAARARPRPRPARGRSVVAAPRR